MRKLLGSSSSRDEEVQIAEIVSVNLSRGSMNISTREFRMESSLGMSS